jgi:hypothetical protein
VPEEPCFRSKPECDLGRFHGLVNDREEFGREGTEVDLVAQAGAERPDSPGHVVAAPVEAPVHRLLDAAAGRLEGRGHGQGGGGHREAGAVGQETAEPEDHRAVPEAEQDGEQPVGDGAADDPVQVVQPVAQDRRPGRERQDRDAEPAAVRNTGLPSRVAPATAPPTVASTATPARATSAATAVKAAPKATQRSCWRSTPRARRKRTTSDPAPTATPMVAIP